MADDLFNFTAAYPSYLAGNDIDALLIQSLPEPQGRDSVDIPVIGLGEQAVYIGPGVRFFQYIIRIEKSTNALLFTTLETLMELYEAIGTVTITAGSNGDYSINNDALTNMKLVGIDYASPLCHSTGKHSRDFSVRFKQTVLVGGYD